MSAQVLRATGIEGALAALEALSGKELTKTSEAVVQRATTRAGVPLLRMELKAAMRRPGSHRDKRTLGNGLHGPPKPPKRGTKGPLERNVTVRNIRKRKGEMVAKSLAPRAWYRHFFIGGTKPHIIEARDDTGARATSGEVRTINRLEGGYYRGNPSEVRALKVGERFYARVRHPGGPQHNVIDPLAGPLASLIQRELTEELLRKTAAAVRTANAKASARRAAKAARTTP